MMDRDRNNPGEVKVTRQPFIPFKEQTQYPKIHRVTIPVEFPSFDLANPIMLEADSVCGDPIVRIIEDYVHGWGDKTREGLEYAVPNTPLLRCGCGTFMEDVVWCKIKPFADLVLRAIEREEEDGFAPLTNFLPPEDIARVRDFTFNRDNWYHRLGFATLRDYALAKEGSGQE